MIAVLIVFLAANKKKESDEKNQDKTETRKIRGSVTVCNVIARKIDNPMSLPNHQVRRCAAATSIVVYDPLDASSIL